MGRFARAAEEIGIYLREGAEVRIKAAKECRAAILEAAELITQSFESGGKLLLCGNGGSAADCQHVAAEFVSRLTKDFVRPAIPAIALTTDSSFITAYGNDCGFDGVFARQVEALGRAGDCLIGISTSGSSKNVVLAARQAKQQGMSAIVLCGTGGELCSICDVAICVPAAHTQFIQETHLAIEHLLCSLVERALYAPEKLG